MNRYPSQKQSLKAQKMSCFLKSAPINGGGVFFSVGRSDGRLQFFDTHTTSLKPATPADAGFAGINILSTSKLYGIGNFFEVSHKNSGWVGLSEMF